MNLTYTRFRSVRQRLLLWAAGMLVGTFSCQKDEQAPTIAKPTPAVRPKADFSFTVKNPGVLPTTVGFSSSASNAASLQWSFANGTTSLETNPEAVYPAVGTYNVKLVASNQAGKDSITKQVSITLTKPKADFTFTTSNLEVLPVTITTTNTTVGAAVTYRWSFGNSSSTQLNPTTAFTSGGIYTIKLVASNAGGSDSITKQIRISPYPQAYSSFDARLLNLYAWEGANVLLLARNNTLNRATMFKWLKAMDATYAYYKLCTGRDPALNPPTYLNNRTTIADVATTCGAGCGYLGATGIELQNTYFDLTYNAINATNQYDQILFYEFGRNFWFYGGKLAYKTNDPITTGYAVFMRFMAMESAGVNGAAFGPWTFPTFRANVENLINIYLATPSLNWANTLGVGQGVPNSGLGATDLFASFCFRLRRDYGGEPFIRNLWKQAGLRPNAVTTQDAVDNFFLASCAAANKNLTAVFQLWRWPLSASAVTAASNYP
ncbi:PKD domain-containing protein (plasmid) [Hymenobacter tibetensis]|uniref:PKD domain-containing protein n=1 Tax=Hymenobacter tibetensis TaxID=497967 RepID=A0ABY4D4J1_9BACT|nr:PKD domain-containing protein [Hymenobacter tibetensis]UOG77425.1 PKD domain-containing protein [Hymenobacter tibetensis]